jgi:hypothetical protein
MPTPLYTLICINRESGKTRIIYGHATINVIKDYVDAYTDAYHYTVCDLYTPDNYDRWLEKELLTQSL